jgi:hypothetical protein
MIPLYESIWSLDGIRRPPYLKMRLMWRIAEAQELNPKWLDVFLEFILTNRAIFESFNRGVLWRVGGRVAAAAGSN